MYSIYICGPMSGVVERNFPAFMRAASQLRELGFTVVNPAELHGDPATLTDADRCNYLRVDIAALVSECSKVATLPGWETSAGARLEVAIATELGMTVAPADEW